MSIDKLPFRSADATSGSGFIPESTKIHELMMKFDTPGYSPSHEELLKLQKEVEIEMCQKYPKIQGVKNKLESSEELIGYNEIIDAFSDVGDEYKNGYAFKIFCHANGIFELLDNEFITEFAKYLDSQVEKYYTETGAPVPILEVGAGNGKLGTLLRSNMKSEKSKFTFILSDSQTSEWQGKVSFGENIEKFSADDAVNKYNPTVVISSWMPEHEDWSYSFRSNDAVKQYILIGDSQLVGNGYETWGWYGRGRSEPPSGIENVPPEEDGFFVASKAEMDKIHAYQIGRTDVIDKNSHLKNSSIMSFERKTV